MVDQRIPRNDRRDERPADLNNGAAASRARGRVREGDLVPCFVCGVLTPVETICHSLAPESTCCPTHREAVNTLAICGVEIFIERCHAAVAAKKVAA